MKKLTLSIICAILAIAVLAQAPQGISHQAVIRDANNQLVTESPIGIQVSIIQGSPEGTVVYSETHLPTSNANGLISFVIGQGEDVSGIFAEIDWAKGPFFIETKADPEGESNYTIEGISQVLSVPYAIYAQQTAGLDEIIEMLIDAGVYRLRDADGNVYRVVRIGEQVWMAENLRTTKYRDNTSIENPHDNSSWQSNTSGAYAWFVNDIDNKEKYGALYNWYAVANTRGLCPEGWKVPDDSDFEQLRNYLINNYEEITSGNVGNTLKSCRQVNSPLQGECDTDEHPRWNENSTHHGTDDFGFSGLPGGSRDPNFFGGLGAHAHWWSATQNNENQAWMRRISFNEGHVDRWSMDIAIGYSVRCLKN